MNDTKPAPQSVDLLEICREALHSGPQWGRESDDLDITLLSWRKGERVEPHVNDEVDVVWLCLEGEGIARLAGQAHDLRPGVLLLLPKGCERAVQSTSEKLVYLSVHRRRPGLMPTLHGRRLA